MGVNVCSARLDDFGAYPGFREPHWALADLVIVFTFLKFARAELPRFVTKSMFAAWGMLIFAASYVVQWLFLAEFWGARCFPLLGLSTKHTRCTARTSRADPHDCCCESGLGPSNHSVWVIKGSRFVLGLGILCCAFDLVYPGLVVWLQRNPTN